MTECSPTNCIACELVSWQVPHWLCLDSGTVSPLRLQQVKGEPMFRCNLPPALLTEWPGSFMCHYSNTGVERTPNKSQHRKLTLEKKILPPLLPGFKLATFWSQVRHSYQQAILAPLLLCYWSRQTLTSLLDSILCLMGIASARFLSDTIHWLMVMSKSVCHTTVPDSWSGPVDLLHLVWHGIYHVVVVDVIYKDRRGRFVKSFPVFCFFVCFL